MGEDRFSSAVAFLHQSLNDAVRHPDTVPARGYGVEFEAVRAFIKQLPRGRDRFGRLRHARNLDSLERHETKSAPGRLCGAISICGVAAAPFGNIACPVERILGPATSPDSMRSRSRRVFSHIDQVSNTLVNPYCVIIDLKLPLELRRRERCGIGPLSFQEVDMAVPETRRNRRSCAVDDADPSRDPHGRAAPNGNDLVAIDQDDAVADGFLCGARIDRPTDQCELRIGLRDWPRARVPRKPERRIATLRMSTVSHVELLADTHCDRSTALTGARAVRAVRTTKRM